MAREPAQEERERVNRANKGIAAAVSSRARADQAPQDAGGCRRGQMRYRTAGAVANPNHAQVAAAAAQARA
ncbi:MAG: hypothetical protein U0802_19450 [Candidatus Binatia bacterium]